MIRCTHLIKIIGFIRSKLIFFALKKIYIFFLKKDFFPQYLIYLIILLKKCNKNFKILNYES